MFLLIAICANSFGNLLLSIGMNGMPDFSMGELPHYIHLLLVNPYLIPGAALSAVYLVAQLSLFSWADLSFVVPLIASTYVLTTLLSRWFLNEHVHTERWLGVALITLGVALVAGTPERTHEQDEEGGA